MKRGSGGEEEQEGENKQKAVILYHEDHTYIYFMYLKRTKDKEFYGIFEYISCCFSRIIHVSSFFM